MSGDPGQIFQRALQAHMAGDAAAAAPLYRRVLKAVPNHADALHLLGLAEISLGNLKQARTMIARAVKVKPDFAAYHGNLGTALAMLGEKDAARDSFRQAIRLDPDFLDAYRNLANLALECEDFAEAAENFSAVIGRSAKPDGSALGYLGLSMMSLCQWHMEDELRGALQGCMEGAEPPIPPFAALTFDTNAQFQRACARRHADFRTAQALARGHKPFTHAARPAGQKLRLGYLSQNFRAHATGFLMADLFEQHDPDTVELFLYADGGEDGSDTRARIRRAAGHFRDLSQMDPWAAAQAIHGDGLDILVDVDGHTARARTEILALKPAPVIVNYLGYPGSLGADHADYILGDATVTPFAAQNCFSERIVQLPHCYQANDRTPPPAAIPTRAECGLPDDAVVLCCFNQTYKIRQPIFGAWMDILAAAPRTVLWLMDAPELARQVMHDCAQAAGIDPDRLIFAPRKPLAEHLARLRHADLFLDTWPVTAHTTATDMLRAGVPLVTMMGETFVTRVAASALKAAGLPELIAANLGDYIRLAVKLATEPLELTALKARMADILTTSPLFDTPAKARAMEAAFRHMTNRHGRDEPPAPFAVAEDGKITAP